MITKAMSTHTALQPSGEDALKTHPASGINSVSGRNSLADIRLCTLVMSLTGVEYSHSRVIYILLT